MDICNSCEGAWLISGDLRRGADARPAGPSEAEAGRRSNFRRTVKWSNSVAAIGAPGLHFHDLRHTGNTHAAATGASLRDLMDRMGHDSARAALIYQHKTAVAGRAIADALSAQIEALEQAHSDGTGTS